MRQILKGSTDQSVVIRIVDETTGIPEQAVEHDSAGIDLWYRREGGLRVAITEAALATLDAAHADGGIEHIDDGYYRLDLPDAAFATGANGVMVGGVVTGMVVIGCYVHLVDYNPQDAVRLGLTALPNAAAEAAGGLYTRGTGAGQINQDANGRIDANMAAVSADAAAADTLELFAEALDQATGQIDNGSLADNAISAAKIAADAITAAKIAADAITAAKIADGAIDAATFAANAINAAAIATDAIDADALAASAAGKVADAVWDEARADHSAAGSFGRGAQIIRDGTAQAGAAGSLTLDAGASASDDFYNNTILVIVGGTGAGQARIISDYNGTTKVATVNGNWVTTPDATSVFIILPFGSIPGATAPTAGEVADAVWDELKAEHTTPDSFGDYLDDEITSRASQASVDSIQTDTDDIQARLPAALVAGRMASDAVAISGSTAAADAVEANIANLNATVSSRSSHAAADVWSVATRTLTAFAFSVNITAAAVQAIWDALTSALVTAGSIGRLIVDNLNAAISSRASQASVDTIDSNVDAILVDTAVIGTPAGASIAADIAAVQADTDNIQTRLPAALVGGRMDASVGAVNGNVPAAETLDRSARAIVRGTVAAGATATSIPTSALDPAAVVADQFKGRIVIFDRDTVTAALRGQATDITANTALGVLTVTALTTAAAAGDSFTIL